VDVNSGQGQRLLSIIGDTTPRQGSVGVPGWRVYQTIHPAVVLLYLLRGEELRGHAQGIAQG